MSKKKKKQTKQHNKRTPESIKQTSKNFTSKQIIICFLLSRLLLFIFLIIKKDLSIFKLYDCIHYINMAKNGYSNPILYAFFPLYPILIKTLSLIIPSYHISGALISNLCSLFSIFILNKLTKDKDNRFNILCFLFTPILAFTSIVYTESLFMLLTILGFYLYKKDKYILSAIIVGLSVLTRNSGIILWGAIGLDMLYRLFITKDKTIKLKNILSFGLISLLIGMLYPLYLYLETGSFLEFITVQDKYWGRLNGTFIDAIINDIKVISRSTDGKFINIIIFLENWISFFLTFILGLKIYKKDKTSSIFIIVSLIAITTSYRDINEWVSLSSISLFRYVFNLFPIYLYIFDNKKESTNIIIFLIFLLLSVFNTILIYQGAFLA